MLAGAEATILRHHPSLMIREVVGAASEAPVPGIVDRAYILDAPLRKFVEITRPEDFQQVHADEDNFLSPTKDQSYLSAGGSLSLRGL